MLFPSGFCGKGTRAFRLGTIQNCKLNYQAFYFLSCGVQLMRGVYPIMSSKNNKAARDSLQQKSPAEFFADNKNIAGFDKVLFRQCLSCKHLFLMGSMELARYLMVNVNICVCCSRENACTRRYESW